MRYLLPAVLCLGLASCGAGSSAPPGRSPPPPLPPAAAALNWAPHILVDQFGYLPASRKVAVIRDPRTGFDSNDRFIPGETYEVRRAEDGQIVFSGRPARWRNGAVDASAGDAGWWFDFSDVKEEGTYFVHDAAREVRSAPFRISAEVYAPILKAAMRTFFYQRSGFAKRAPWAEECWTDDAAYLGPGQDAEARDVTDRDNPDKVRDLSGGWFDAGDTNKYVTFASAPVHQLLSAYEANPAAFTDDFDIPESGNGVPDLIDEVKWEIDWLRRMQQADGGVALKVGVLDHAAGMKPSLDRAARYYIPVCSSATIAAAGMFAHAALVFGEHQSLAAERQDLQRRAENAWKHFHGSPRQVSCDNGEVKAGDADWDEQEQDSEAVVAAVYLFALTGAREYADYVKAHHRETKPWRDVGWSRYNPQQGEALLFHARQANVDRATATAITRAKTADVDAGHQVYGFDPDADLYRAFLHPGQYHWGSNQVRANYGNTNLDGARLLRGARAEALRNRAEEILHYFHGVNPFSMVYLSNMYAHGATRSINEVFHSWFWHESQWDHAMLSPCGPAPGFVPGGPNASAGENGVPGELKPPVGQPPQKSYRDWNTPWPDSSWAISEPGIYYQAAYVRLLSQFVN